MIKTRFLPALVLAALVTGCGGGGGSVAPSASTANNAPANGGGGSTTTPGSGGQASMSLKVTIPNAAAQSSSKLRKPQYIPAATGSMELQLLAVNGAYVLPAPAAQGPFNLTAGPTNPNCVAGATATTCTFQISAPVGNDIFVATTFTGANGSGTALGSGSVLLSVVQNASNSANLSLTGPVNTVNVVSASTSLYNGNPVFYSSSARATPGTAGAAGAVRKPAASSATPSPYAPTVNTIRIFVIALDAAGNQIINPTTFDIPITLQLNLNGTPANTMVLGVTYAGLPGEPSAPASTTTDGGTITVLAPSDTVTLGLQQSAGSSNYYGPSVVAKYTPQTTNMSTTSPPLTFSVVAPPPGAFLQVSANHVATPITAGVQTALTMAVTNLGNGPTSGTTTATVQLSSSGWTLNNTTGSDPSWTCVNQGYQESCTSPAVIAAGASLPLIFNVTPSTQSPDTTQLQASNNSAVNFGASVTDTFNVVTNALLSATINGNNNAFYTTVGGTYVITLTNSGPQDTSGPITVINTLPGNFFYNGSAGAGWACSAALQIITCTYTGAPIVHAGGTSALTLDVTPAIALQDTLVNDSLTGSGGNSTPFTATTSTKVVGPIQFASETLGNNTKLIPTPFTNIGSNDQMTLDVAYPPGASPGLSGQIFITAEYNYVGLYSLSADTCTNNYIDNTFATAIGSTNAGGFNVPTAYGINVIAATNGTCSLKVNDTNGNSSTLSIQVESSTIIIQQHARPPGNGVNR